MTYPQRPAQEQAVSRYSGPRSSSLADVLERVLDRGVVIAGDIVVGLLDIELLTLKVRLLIASADTAKQMGIDWWVSDPFLNSRAAAGHARIEAENQELRARLAALERQLDGNGEPVAVTGDRETAREDQGSGREVQGSGREVQGSGREGRGAGREGRGPGREVQGSGAEGTRTDPDRRAGARTAPSNRPAPRRRGD